MHNQMTNEVMMFDNAGKFIYKNEKNDTYNVNAHFGSPHSIEINWQ